MHILGWHGTSSSLLGECLKKQGSSERHTRGYSLLAHDVTHIKIKAGERCMLRTLGRILSLKMVLHGLSTHTLRCSNSLSIYKVDQGLNGL